MKRCPSHYTTTPRRKKIW